MDSETRAAIDALHADVCVAHQQDACSHTSSANMRWAYYGYMISPDFHHNLLLDHTIDIMTDLTFLDTRQFSFALEA